MVVLVNSQLQKDGPKPEDYTLSKVEIAASNLKKLKADYTSLKAVHGALVLAVDRQSDILQSKIERIEFLEKSLQGAHNLVEINKKIMIDALTKQNEDKETHNSEIQRIKRKQRQG